MSDEFRGRRRLQRPGSRRSTPGSGGPSGWLITIAAVIVVLVAGWFLGMALAHVVGGRRARVASLPTPVPLVSPSPAASAAAVASPSPPLPTATPARIRTPKPHPTFAPTAAPIATPTLTPVITPSPMPPAAPTSAPTKTAPVLRPPASKTPATAAPGVVPPADTAAQIVRGYIDAMKAGNLERAQQFLGNGSPDESFIGASTRIASITSKPNGDGSFNVAADMRSSGTEYYETFVVAPTSTGDRILQKTAIKP